MSRDSGPGDLDRFYALTVPCPVCKGAGRWHQANWSPCYTDSCPNTHTDCMYCGGRKRVMPVWRNL